MDTRELLTHLEKLEYGLDSFSFSELKSAEASKLKESFEAFKNGLEEKVFGLPISDAIQTENPVNEKYDFQEGQLVANVSHEIRTPLNGIIGFLDLLQETHLNPQQKELVNAMGSASKNLLGVINQLLELSVLAAGQEKFEKVSFNPANLVNEVSFLCKTLINGKQVELLVHYDENIPKYLLGDPSKLSQVLLNLTGNAIKFVEKGEIRLHVHLKEEKNKKVFLEFVVSDTGIGIANEHLKHIFESYRQAEPETKLKYGGSGLGLSIVKEIIEKQHGCLAVSSTLGVGTTFKVILPFEKVQIHQDNENKTDKTKPVDISGKSILVLEDDALTQKLMGNRLEQWGCKAYITENGLFGLQLLESHHIDLLLLDMHLPGMDGFEIVQRIRKNPKFKNLPIIVLSGDAYTRQHQNFEKLGISDFILKPYNSEELLEKIDNNSKQMEQKIEEILVEEVEKQNEVVQTVDLNPILEECLEKTELLDELIRLFEQNILEFIGKTKMHLQSRNIQGVGFAAHKIKSSLKMLHANGLIKICEEMILECRTSNDLERLKTLFEDFVTKYPKVEMAINLELKRIKYKL
ncbi:MAG: ATP-binding protein [Bacteroidota bacterium]